MAPQEKATFIPYPSAFPAAFFLQSIQRKTPGTCPSQRYVWHRRLPSSQPETCTCQDHSTYPSCDIFVSGVIFLPQTPTSFLQCYITYSSSFRTLRPGVSCGLLHPLSAAPVRWGAQILTSSFPAPPSKIRGGCLQPAQLTEPLEASCPFLMSTSVSRPLASGGVKRDSTGFQRTAAPGLWLSVGQKSWPQSPAWVFSWYLTFAARLDLSCPLVSVCLLCYIAQFGSFQGKPAVCWYREISRSQTTLT